MASWIELCERLENGLAADSRLYVHAAYRGGPLPAWLSDPVDEAMATAPAGTLPVTIFNVKGNRSDAALCVLSLADLERLIGGE